MPLTRLIFSFVPQAILVRIVAQRQPGLPVRTLSKAFTLAGLRCGFVLGNETLIALLLKVIAPYPLPTLVADIATQALSSERIVLMRQRVSEIATYLRWLQ